MMRPLSPLIQLFGLCLFFACQTKELESMRREQISLDSIPQTALEMELITTVFEWGDVSTPDLHLAGDSLIALSYFKNAAALHFYTVAGKDLGQSSIRKLTDSYPLPVDPGYRGKFAFLHPNTNIYYEYEVRDGALWLNDFTRMRLQENAPWQAVRLDDEHFAFIGNYPDGLWGIWEEPTRVLTFYGDYPVVKEDKPRALIPFYNGRIALSDDQLVYVSYQFGFLSSYRVTRGKRLQKLWEKQVSSFLYTENDLGFVFNERHKNGFIEVYFVGDHIYTLYNGCDETMGEEFTNSIVVFTREGRPVARYTLPEAISYMKFDSRGRYAYATFSPRAGQVQQLVRFILPELTTE